MTHTSFAGRVRLRHGTSVTHMSRTWGPRRSPRSRAWYGMSERCTTSSRDDPDRPRTSTGGGKSVGYPLVCPVPSVGRGVGSKDWWSLVPPLARGRHGVKEGEGRTTYHRVSRRGSSPGAQDRERPRWTPRPVLEVHHHPRRGSKLGDVVQDLQRLRHAVTLHVVVDREEEVTVEDLQKQGPPVSAPNRCTVWVVRGRTDLPLRTTRSPLLAHGGSRERERGPVSLPVLASLSHLPSEGTQVVPWSGGRSPTDTLSGGRGPYRHSGTGREDPTPAHGRGPWVVETGTTGEPESQW